jgi:light-regulated signal transduction histidine kinase (bacteriophytochrome)
VFRYHLIAAVYSVRYNSAAVLTHIYCCPLLFSSAQVMYNLGSNAVKYSNEGTVTIALRMIHRGDAVTQSCAACAAAVAELPSCSDGGEWVAFEQYK